MTDSEKDELEIRFKFMYNWDNFISLFNEGLLHTYPILTAVKLITREISSLEIKAKIDKEEGTNTIFIKGYSNSFLNKDLKKLIRAITTCGYFPSTFEFYNDKDELIKSVIYKDFKNNKEYDEFFKLVNNDISNSFFAQIAIESKFNEKSITS